MKSINTKYKFLRKLHYLSSLSGKTETKLVIVKQQKSTVTSSKHVANKKKSNNYKAKMLQHKTNKNTITQKILSDANNCITSTLTVTKQKSNKQKKKQITKSTHCPPHLPLHNICDIRHEHNIKLRIFICKKIEITFFQIANCNITNNIRLPQ